MKTVYTIAVGLFVGACSESGIADDGTPVLHPVEAVCIDYEMSGQMMKGTSTRCHRDNGYEQYEIRNMEVGAFGITQKQSQHTITIGDTVYAIDLQTNRGTKTVNPIYANIVSRLEDTAPEDMGAAFISAMGFNATGNTRTVAGTECNVYNSPQLGTACLTDNGLLLEQSIMGNTETATNVAIGDSGDDANYALYETVPITDGPDLSKGLQGIMDQMGRQ